MKISIITTTLPSRSQYLTELSLSVDKLKNTINQDLFSIEWVVIQDGKGEIPLLKNIDKHIILESQKGISIARNVGLSQSTGDWVMPVDADDTINVSGVISIISKIIIEQDAFGWFSANRLLMSGEKTPHWNDTSKIYEKGTLSECWTAPFPFHPNSIIVNRSCALKIGGWPATLTIEDMAFSLMLSENFRGSLQVDVITNYRIWEEQEVSSSQYLTNKPIAMNMIENIINANRFHNNLPLIKAPSAGIAFGKIKSV
jgi:glycosyltransferase involved in cell wall biosynthesis